MINVVLVEPEIPPNTGNIARLCLAAGARLHLVEPLGFRIDDRALKRAGMDYWHQCEVHRWKSFAELKTANPHGRFFFLTTKSQRIYWSINYQDEDFLVFGRETRGLPESLLAEYAGTCLTIPMRPEARSLNLATAVGVVLYEAVRQLANISK
ncbi:MAG: tRNA (uridine(34)/cytosine(34)/5-carboxymethylaminomethyluridine(34)-2'-O)-methyltransferase TrmL [Verrucomicrobia bacterium]|nr:MAG: tRNA (uridine(34)/cytosine(34)/5-carboxymethylaminomethyluridine(34)-2'-O)-methyltransferase TrmL [Verrucomicrobiota bacterium]